MPALGPDRKEERRRNLLDAAWRCAGSKGFAELTVEDICEAAGVSKGSFYGYFTSKLDLLIGLLDDDAARLEARIEELTATKKTGIDRLEAFAKAMLERGDDAGRVQIQSDLWAAAANEEVVRARFSESIRHRRGLLRGWIEESMAQGDMREVPANALASIVLALGDALMLHASLDPSGFQWRNVRTALGILLEDLRPG